MINRLLKYSAIIIGTLLLSGCGENPCISADDWGYPKVYVPANGEGMDLQGEMAEQSVKGLGASGGQKLLDVDKIPLVITTNYEDKWTSWLGGTQNGSWEDLADGETSIGKTAPGFDVEDVIPEHKECLYQQVEIGSLGITAPKYKKARSRVEGSVETFDCPRPTEIVANPDRYADCWVPCWFKDGMGLYIGLAPDAGGEDDVVITKHIPDPKKPEVPKVFDPETNNPNYDQREQDGYLIRGLASDEIPGAITGDAVYFKIVDLFYEDNSGGYNVTIKSGTRSKNSGPLETVFEAFYRPVKNLMERLYKGIVNNPEYIRTVQAALVLYILFYSYAYLMGMVEKPKIEFISRVVKFGLIVQLISPTSWNFFYNNFFGAFVDGIIHIAALVSTPFPDYDPNSPWFSLDEVLRKFTSAETAAKVSSTLFTNLSGLVFIFIFYVALGLFVISIIKALMVYIVSYIGIAFLVMLAPIFIIFLLFEKTKGLFDDWVKHFISFAMQQIILFAGLGLFATLLYHYLTQTVGYRVCWETWFSFSLLGYNIVDLKFWFPNIREIQADLWMDWGRGIFEFYTEYRPEAEYQPSMWPFIDLPYFDPNKELLKIREYQKEHDFLKWGDVFVFGAVIYFMFSFMSFVPTIANAIKGGGKRTDTADAFSSGRTLWKGLKGTAMTGVDVARGAVGSFSIDGDKTFGFGQEDVKNSSGKVMKDVDGSTVKRTSLTLFGVKWSGGVFGAYDTGRQGVKDLGRSMSGLGKAIIEDARDIKTAAVGKEKIHPGQRGPGASGGGSNIENYDSQSHQDSMQARTLVDVHGKIQESRDKLAKAQEGRSASAPVSGTSTGITTPGGAERESVTTPYARQDHEVKTKEIKTVEQQLKEEKERQYAQQQAREEEARKRAEERRNRADDDVAELGDTDQRMERQQAEARKAQEAEDAKRRESEEERKKETEKQKRIFQLESEIANIHSEIEKAEPGSLQEKFWKGELERKEKDLNGMK